ncbi:MAG: ribosomal protein S18-alanine N-acetyltransferase [Actinomycetes bacterium]
MTALPGVSIEPLRWWQLRECVAIERVVFPSTAWSEESFWGELARSPESRYYVTAVREADTPTSESVVIGYAGLAALPPEADVQTIAVEESARGIGLGRALLDELIDEAVRRHCTTVMLEVADDNDRAIELYERRGFESISVRRDYYGPSRDARIMRLRVGVTST